MRELVTDDDLARARRDPAFRQQFLAQNLDLLLEALNKARRSTSPSQKTAGQIREGVDLAVKLAGRLQREAGTPGPQAA
jgi:hypothetical protein